MKKRLSQKELAEIRKKELAKKELEFQIGRDLRIEDEKRKVAEKALENKNPFILGAVNFFGTMFFGYLAFGIIKFCFFRLRVLVSTLYPNTAFLKYLDVDSVVYVDTFFSVFHVAIWGISLIAVVRKKSPLDDWFS